MTAQRRILTVDEITRVLKNQHGDEFELPGEIKVERMATQGGGVFKVKVGREGQEHLLRDCGPAEIEKISAALWDEFGSCASNAEDDLTPAWLKDKPDDGDPLTPDDLKDKPEPENLEPDPHGLTPDRLRDIIADPGLARRLADGTATPAEKLDDLLMPENLKGASG